MAASDDPAGPLYEALKHSPGNVPLVKHLAGTLLGLGRVDEAERVLREALEKRPGDAGLKLGLAEAFRRGGKAKAALVVVEDLLGQPHAPAAAHLEHARLLLQDGEPERAGRAYRRAIEADPEVADEGLAKALGVPADGRYRPDGDDDELKRIRITSSGDDGARPDDLDLALERPALTFADVGGMDALKREIRMKIIHPLQHPELYEAYGKKPGGGILMYGPPGCGKTHLARATAGEVQAKFLAVGIHDVLDMWLGESERKLHEVFDYARRNKPCVLFFDEVDALGASRSDMRRSAGRHLINQLLSELDGAQHSNDGVLVLGATNAPWHLDPAFRRPGRFDRIIFVPPPDQEARVAILGLLLAGKPVKGVDAAKVAKKADGFSGADLKALVDAAVETKLEQAIEAGVPTPIVTKDLLRAAKGLKPTTREWFASAKNYALYSNQGGFYDDVLGYLKLG